MIRKNVNVYQNIIQDILKDLFSKKSFDNLRSGHIKALEKVS
jgi:flagellar basal body-associated protein FliL